MALGASQYGSPYSLWCDKVGLTTASEAELERQEWGHLLEAPIAAKVAEKTGYTLFDPGEFTICVSWERDWLFCTPDRIAVTPDDEIIPVQIKTTSGFMGASWDDEPPLPYQIQVQHELAVLQCDRALLAVLIGGQRFRMYEIQADTEFIARMVEIEEEFWLRVLGNNPPEVDGSQQTSSVLSRLYPARDHDPLVAAVTLPPESDDWHDELVRVEQEARRASERVELLKNRFKARIGESHLGVTPRGRRYSWKPVKSKDSFYRVFRRLPYKD